MKGHPESHFRCVAPEIRGSDLEFLQMLIANSIKVRTNPSTVSIVWTSIKYFSFHFTDFISKPVTTVPDGIFFTTRTTRCHNH
jgi:hypothetical protein